MGSPTLAQLLAHLSLHRWPYEAEALESDDPATWPAAFADQGIDLLCRVYQALRRRDLIDSRPIARAGCLAARAWLATAPLAPLTFEEVVSAAEDRAAGRISAEKARAIAAQAERWGWAWIRLAQLAVSADDLDPTHTYMTVASRGGGYIGGGYPSSRLMDEDSWRAPRGEAAGALEAALRAELTPTVAEGLGRLAGREARTG